jgi:hypothetical protein
MSPEFSVTGVFNIALTHVEKRETANGRFAVSIVVV